MAWLDCKMRLFEVPYNIEIVSASQFNGLNAEDKYNAACFFSETSDPITHVAMSFLDYAGATQPYFETGIVDLDSSGRPNSTFLGGGSPASVVWQYQTSPSWNNSTQILELDNPYTPSLGEPFAILTKWYSGTISSSVRPQPWAYVNGGFYNKYYYQGMPVFRHYNGSTWSSYDIPVLAYKTATRAYGAIVYNGGYIDISTSGHKACLKFTVPDNFPRLRIGAMYWEGSLSVATSIKAGIWNSSGTELQGISINPAMYDNSGISSCAIIPVSDGDFVDLEPGSTYYIGLEAGGANIYCPYRDFKHASLVSCLSGPFTAYQSMWNGSTWTDQDTRFQMAIPIVYQIENAGGGSPPSMNGGFCN